jgi:hypothetical protein
VRKLVSEIKRVFDGASECLRTRCSEEYLDQKRLSDGWMKKTA